MTNFGALARRLSAVLLLIVPFVADAFDDRWYLAPGARYIIADDDRNADDDYGIGLAFGKAISERFNLEADVMWDRLDFEDSEGEFEQWGLTLGTLFFFNRNPGFSPFLLGAVGFTDTDTGVEDGTNPVANFGGGFLSELTDHGTALRADVRYRYDADEDSIASEDGFGDWIVNVGLSIPIGARAAAAPVAVPVDSDGDGVPDDQDDCPGTPPGAQVDERGCELDSDGDGVVDSQDRCPNTPPGTKVDRYGCELDSDGDGVVDGKDLCPNTPPGTIVDAVGCPAKTDIILEGVNFKLNSAELTPEALAILDGVAATLSRHPNVRIEVEGHTDRTGTAAYNQTLSERRAASVVDYLSAHGLDRGNLDPRGYGEEMPIVSNDTREGRAENRRVELHVVEDQ